MNSARQTPEKNSIGNTPCPSARNAQYAANAPAVPQRFWIGGYGYT